METKDLIDYLENAITKKDELNKDTTGVDNEIMAWISVYKHGSKVYREQAKRVLAGIAYNANLIDKKGLRKMKRVARK